MKLSALKCLFLIILATFFSGCREAATFEVALYEDESLSRGDTVFLEGEPIAKIEDIYLIGEDRPVAKIRLIERDFEDLLIRGTQRKPGRGEIHLERPRLSEEQEAEPLLTGSRIPLRSIPLPPSVWPPNQNTIIFIVVALVLILLIFFVLLKFMRALGTIVLLVGASIAAWFTYPHALPYAEQVVELIESQTAERQETAEATNVQDTEAIDRAMTHLTGFLKKEHLNATYVAFGSLTLIYYFVLSILSGFFAKIPLFGIAFRRKP